MSENNASNNRQLLVLPGTVTVPSIGFSGSNKTGIYSPGTNQLAITNNGVQSLVFDASGNATFAGTVNFPGGGGTVTTSNTVTLTNKTINGANNTLTVRLANDVSGTLPVANGGTGLTTMTAANNAIYSTSASAVTAGTLPVAAGGTGLTTATAANNAIYSTSASALTAGTLPVLAGGTGSTTAAGARTALGAAASGANTDITALDQDVTITATGTIAADTIGFRGVPQNAQTSTYTLVLADAGKHISITTGGITVPANSGTAFPIGSVITIFNNSSSSQNITCSDTLRLAGTGTSGSPRALAQYGVATLLKVAATVWIVTGAGVS